MLASIFFTGHPAHFRKISGLTGTLKVRFQVYHWTLRALKVRKLVALKKVPPTSLQKLVTLKEEPLTGLQKPGTLKGVLMKNLDTINGRIKVLHWTPRAL